jgi:CRISPR system Cascade subunit CasC
MFKEGALFTTEQKRSLAERTRLLADEITRKLCDANKTEAEARPLVEIALNAAELQVKENGQTEYLVFIGQAEIGTIAQLCIERWDKLMEVDTAYAEARDLQTRIKDADEKAKSGNKDEKLRAKAASRELKEKLKAAQEAARKSIPKDLKDAVLKSLDGGKAADLALFGRMLADLPEKNIDAASQVAHAISTHKSGVEFDFYTAVDDLQTRDETGAGMMGTIEFNSACFYRYANLDLGQLKANLQDDTLEQATTEAFIRAFIEAVPTGKQHSTAPQQKPAFVLAVVRETGLWSLANAFANPVPTNRGDLVEESITRLDKHWGELAAMYGTKGFKGQWFAALGVEHLDKLGERVQPAKDQTMIDALVAKVSEAINGSNQTQAQS